MANTGNAAYTVRSKYPAAVDGDQEKFFGCVADDFVLEEPPYLSYGRTHSGRDGIAESFAAATTVIDLSTLEIVYVLRDGERACAAINCAVVGADIRASIIEEWIVGDGSVHWGRVYWFDPSIVPAQHLSRG